MDRASDYGVEGLGDNGAKERGEIVTEEANQAADLEDASEEHATDAGRVLQGFDQGDLELVEHALQPAGQRELERGGMHRGRLECRYHEHSRQCYRNENRIP